MLFSRLAGPAFAAILIAASVSAAPPDGKGGGKGGGGGDDGSDPPAEFVPEIAYFFQGKKTKDLRIANRAGDAACLVLQVSDGEPTLRGFDFDVTNQRLAYSVAETGIYITDWLDGNPCTVASADNKTDPNLRVRTLSSGDHPEFMDFSPGGNFLAWTEGVDGYQGYGSAAKLVIYDVNKMIATEHTLEAWGGKKDEWGVDGEWAASSVRFSPDFATSNEIIFRGGPLDGSQGAYNSLFAYNIAGTSAPRKIFDGGNISMDIFFAITNPGGAGEARVALTDNDTGQIIQSPLAGGSTISFAGYVPEYSCDNTELIHTYSGRKKETRITSVDGGSSETWSRDTLRWLDWLCP